MRVGMFGGSFNPVHCGHVQLVESFIIELSLDRVFVVPAFVSPFKLEGGAVIPEHRLEMCRLAFADIPQVTVSDIEILRQGASYTYQTLITLSEKCCAEKIYLLLGADSFLTVQDWKKPESIFEHAVICGIPRETENAAVLEKHASILEGLGAQSLILRTEVMTVSSTQIRNLIKKGQSISGLVPRSVEQYIQSHQLYC